MRRIILFLLIGTALILKPALADQYGCPGQTASYVNYAREAITISSTALPFTAATYATSVAGLGSGPVQLAMVTLETNPIRISTDGVAPTTTVGDLWTNGTNVKFSVCGTTNVQLFRAIATGSDAAITVTYWRAQ